MRSPSQHSIHRRLGRIPPSNHISSKTSSLDSRSPQFGPPFGGNFGGNFGGGRGDSDRDRGPPGQGFGGGGNRGGPPAGRPNPGPSFGRPEPGPPFGRPNPQPPFGGGDQRPPFGFPSPRPPTPPAPAPTPAPFNPPSNKPANPPTGPAPGSGQPENGGAANQVGGAGTNLNNGDGGNNNRSPSTGTGAHSSAGSVSSAASQGTPVVLGASPVPASTSSDQAASTFSSTLTIGGSPLETIPAIETRPAGADSDGSAAPTINPTGGVSKKGLSGGIIAAIVILTLLFVLMILVLLLRRRWIARRSERFGAWWTTRRRNSRPYGDSPTYANEKQAPFEWNRDDFAVRTMDRSASPLDLSNIVPMAPPVAEVRRLRNGSDAHLIAPTPSERFSIGSGDSFVVHHTTVVSPHRASGTESFKFPKPPSHSDLATAASIHSRLGSNSSNSGAASVTAACGHTPLNQSQPSSLGSRPPLTPHSPPQSRQPSADGIPNPFADADGSDSIHNPFANESISIGPLPLAVGDLARTEKIRRPFLPTMNDELSVAVDDEVKILQIFDDGWALVKKLEPTPIQGLIPLACLRDMGQGLTSLLSTRRVQSIHVSEQITE